MIYTRRDCIHHVADTVAFVVSRYNHANSLSFVHPTGLLDAGLGLDPTMGLWGGFANQLRVVHGHSRAPLDLPTLFLVCRLVLKIETGCGAFARRTFGKCERRRKAPAMRAIHHEGLGLRRGS